MATETVEQRDDAPADRKTAWTIASDLSEIQDRLRIAEELITEHVGRVQPCGCRERQTHDRARAVCRSGDAAGLEAFGAEVEALYALSHHDRLAGGDHATR